MWKLSDRPDDVATVSVGAVAVLTKIVHLLIEAQGNTDAEHGSRFHQCSLGRAGLDFNPEVFIV